MQDEAATEAEEKAVDTLPDGPEKEAAEQQEDDDEREERTVEANAEDEFKEVHLMPQPTHDTVVERADVAGSDFSH